MLWQSCMTWVFKGHLCDTNITQSSLSSAEEMHHHCMALALAKSSAIVVSVHAHIKLFQLLWRGTQVPPEAYEEVHKRGFGIAPSLQPAPACLRCRLQDLHWQ